MSMENSPELARLDVSQTIRHCASRRPNGGVLAVRLAKISDRDQCEEPLRRGLSNSGGVSQVPGWVHRKRLDLPGFGRNALHGVTARVTASNAHKTGVIGIPGIAYLAALKHNAIM